MAMIKEQQEMVASNYLLSDTAEGQFNEMKTVAERNTQSEEMGIDWLYFSTGRDR